MPVKPKPIKRIYAWSFSRWNKYVQCPFLLYLTAIMKLREPENDAIKRGKKIHNEAEGYSTGEIKRRPKSLDCFPEEFKHLRKIRKKLQTELDLAVDLTWSIVDWFSPKAWLRAKIDALYTYKRDDMTVAKVIDYKTGKVRDQKDQLEIYASVVSAKFPDVDLIECEFWYLDHGEIVGETYTMKEALAFRKKWTAATKPMFQDRSFKPKPSRKCVWCHFSKDKGGPCKY